VYMTDLSPGGHGPPSGEVFYAAMRMPLDIPLEEEKRLLSVLEKSVRNVVFYKPRTECRL
jgi:hypothetical protein